MEPGTCYRLWTNAEHQALLPRRPPEILEADLAPLALDLAEWGVRDATELSWLDPPPAGALAQARDLLRQLGALDAQDALTAHGRRLAHVTVHPRLAHMMVAAVPLGLGSLACDLAALLSERDILQGGPGWRNADLRLRIEALHGNKEHLAGATINQAGCERVRRASDQWQRQLRLGSPSGKDIDQIGILLTFAYPDRVAQRLAGSEGRYRLANGRGAAFQGHQSLSQDEYLVVAQLDGTGDWARILAAAPVRLQDLERYCAAQICSVDLLEWDDRSESVRARRQRRFGQLILEDRAAHEPDQAQVTAALLTGLRRAGLAALPWTKEQQQWRARAAFLHRVDPAWPDLSNDSLTKTSNSGWGRSCRGSPAWRNCAA